MSVRSVRDSVVVWMGVVAFTLLATSMPVQAQELDCSVSVDYSQLSGSRYTYLDQFERAVESYLNERSWTDDTFRAIERIDCSLQIVFLQATSLTDFQARLVVATLRPIHGTTQATPVVRLNDGNWRFSYAEGTPLIHTPEEYDPLTSVLDYYAYLILGYDYDTFSERGGTPYFEEARRIAERARSVGGAGWSGVSGTESRTDLIEELLDPQFRPLRNAYFAYHLRGLDRFVNATTEARGSVLDALKRLNALYDSVSRSFAIDMFFAAKYEEVTAIFTDAPSSSEAYAILSQIDPSHLSEYNQLVN